MTNIFSTLLVLLVSISSFSMSPNEKASPEEKVRAAAKTLRQLRLNGALQEFNAAVGLILPPEQEESSEEESSEGEPSNINVFRTDALSDQEMNELARQKFGETIPVKRTFGDSHLHRRYNSGKDFQPVKRTDAEFARAKENSSNMPARRQMGNTGNTKKQVTLIAVTRATNEHDLRSISARREQAELRKKNKAKRKQRKEAELREFIQNNLDLPLANATDGYQTPENSSEN